ncbi:MAG TPA: helix-turn-helix transcriptional regulator, partial [Kofleriaceae bacterium]|nr:helix-turn-helix transcriptional regulator [Kofleriaceae bacterium]
EGHARSARTDAVPRTVRAEATAPLARLDASAPASEAPPGAVEPEGTLEQRIALLARSAALSPREHEVLQLLLLGRNYAEIGTALQITPRTARFHQHNLLEKIGAESRLDIVRLLL